jgi:mRNA-degrading endonuclease RelE of RelBE toxin-antitoxin system
MRTTLDIDKPILDELKRLGKRRKKTIGRLASELLATSLKREHEKSSANTEKAFRWNSRSMGSLLNIEDKDALYRALDEER